MTPIHDIVRLRAERSYLLARATRKSWDLKSSSNKTELIRSGDLLAAVCARNEMARLPYFLDYYRRLGVSHFLFVDNGSEDGSVDYLAQQPDCSVWVTAKSYRKARFGMDWLNHLLGKYGQGHWVLTVDPDEYFVYPHQDTRPLSAVLEWLDAGNIRNFGATLLDMYPKDPPTKVAYKSGQNPLDFAPFFDPQNYQSRIEKFYFNLWIQGGPRQRMFFHDRPQYAPALNKIPLVKWSKGLAYRSSTHQMLPRSLNVTYSMTNNPRPCGCLLHFKFLDILATKSSEELKRKEHFASSREYRAYAKRLDHSLWTTDSALYENWRQLSDLGLMSAGDWV